MDYREFIEYLKTIILPLLEEEDIGLVELNFVKAKGRPILKLLLDKKGGRISLEDCARLNEKIGIILDTQDIMKNGYILEVSSPGLDRPLKTKGDFLRCLNRSVKFFLAESINGKTELEGIINKVEDGLVYVEIDENIVEIPLAKINKAKQTLSIE